MSYHQITILGRITKDAESRFTPAGKAVATFNLAVDDGWGEQKKTIWVRVTLWEQEKLTPYLVKGTQVLAVGRLQSDDKGNPRTFARQDGTTGTSFEVTASVVRLVGGKRTDAEPGSVEAEAEDLPF